MSASRNLTAGSRDFEASVHYVKGEIYNFGVNDKLPPAGAPLEDFQKRREDWGSKRSTCCVALLGETAFQRDFAS